MGRLIDADLLLERIVETNNVYVQGRMAYIIDNMPTAYDLEAVVKELEERESEYMFPDDDDYTCGQYDAMREAIEIVKGGVK